MDREIRAVHEIVEPQPVVEGAGVRLRRSIATRRLGSVDPFLLFDHFGSNDPADYLAGFPMHPHRGIDTVTYVLEGIVHHKDSLGNSGSIGPGDVQWMTAGGGILHEEMPKPKDGKMDGFQLWVNLPARRKMSRPRYRDVPGSTIPEARREDGVRIRVVAGEADGVRGPVSDPDTDPSYLDVSLPAGRELVHPVPRGHAAFAYLFGGEAAFGPGEGTAVRETRLIRFADGEAVRARGTSRGARFLLVSGKPLGEPIARYGPFVMNTREEIEQALEDLRRGTFVWTG